MSRYIGKMEHGRMPCSRGEHSHSALEDTCDRQATSLIINTMKEYNSSHNDSQGGEHDLDSQAITHMVWYGDNDA